MLEHIAKHDIVSSLEAVGGALQLGGTVVIKVPNASNTFGLVARYLDFTHEVAFSEHSLKQVLIAASFDEVEVRGMKTTWKPTLKCSAYWLANAAYQQSHRAVYVAAVGTDAQPAPAASLYTVRDHAYGVASD